MITLNEILKKEPTLTPFGIEGPGTFKSNNPEFEPDDISQIEDCITWLKDKPRTKRINNDISSYGLKHQVESDMGCYVSNGAFIAAVIHLQIPYKRIPQSPNILIAIKRKNPEREFLNKIKADH